ncbi:unnamed protein product [Phytophthora fragariaefolia]|uniref:Unnamed protein product n=1 Tax=Phytophthora fragariaefolia TaxID=1490495 RepID=A0A9W7CYM1_9STRA|nr:unnamed protein product [Phytophthora fragariaefolia]
MTELLESVVTRAQLDAALSTKVSTAHVDAQMDTMRAEVAAHLNHKADLASLLSLQSSKLDVSVFEANSWDLHKLRVAMEQHVRDLFATFAGQLEQQVGAKLGVEDFNRVFNLEATGQKSSLEAAALRMAKITDQLDSLNNYVNGDRQRQRQVAELNVNMLDLNRKQTAARNSIVQLESAEQSMAAQLRALDEQTNEAMVNLQALTETLGGLQAQTQVDKNAQDARQARLTNDVKQLETHSQHLTNALNELKQYAHSGLVGLLDTKMKSNNETLRNEFNEIAARNRQHTQQLGQRMNKANELLLHHKERLAQLDACMLKLAGLLKETQGELNKSGMACTFTSRRNRHEWKQQAHSFLHLISQNGTRDIMLDYQDLLERRKSSQVFVPLPSRPSSSSSSVSNDSVSASRKHKQQVLLGAKSSSRPHTSSGRVRVCSTPNGILPGTRPGLSAGAVRGSRSPSIPSRAQTAGATPKNQTGIAQLLSTDNNISVGDVKEENPAEGEQEIRIAARVLVRKPGSPDSRTRQSVPAALFRHATGNNNGELFYFPESDNDLRD